MIPADQEEGFETEKDSLFLTRDTVLAFTNTVNLHLPSHSIQQWTVCKAMPQIRKTVPDLLAAII